jgi:hypothetical protein
MKWRRRRAPHSRGGLRSEKLTHECRQRVAFLLTMGRDVLTFEVFRLESYRSSTRQGCALYFLCPVIPPLYLVLDPRRVGFPPAVGFITRCLEYDIHATAQEVFAWPIAFGNPRAYPDREGNEGETVVSSDEVRRPTGIRSQGRLRTDREQWLANPCSQHGDCERSFRSTCRCIFGITILRQE